MDENPVVVIDASSPLCYYGGGAGDHAWCLLDGKIQCRDCPEVVAPRRLYEVFTEYHRIVETGLAILQGELDALRADAEAAAGELLGSLDEMPVGSSGRRLMLANRLIRGERDEARGRTWALLQLVRQLQKLAEDGAPHHAIATQCEAAIALDVEATKW